MAVYTKLSREQIVDIVHKYDIGQLQDFKEIVQGIDNSNFVIFCENKKFILTIFESRIKQEDLPFFINLKLHLAKNNICCPCPIINNNGFAIDQYQNKKISIVSFLEGKILENRNDGYYDNITDNHCFSVGNILSRMHIASSGFKEKRINDLGIDGFNSLLNKFINQVNQYQNNLFEEITSAINFVKENWDYGLDNGACHLDLFPDNVFFDNCSNVSGVIDFYFAANDLLIYDFAICVNAWCFDENNNFIESRFKKMLDGYQKNRLFKIEEINFLKIALIAASLRFLLTRLYDMFFTKKDSLVNIKNPQEYIAKLRFFVNKYDNKTFFL